MSARYGLDDLDDFVLYLGSYVAHKNVRLLLAAYTYVAQALGQDVPLVLAGHTPATWGTPRFPDLPAYIDEIGVGDVVRWIGPVDEADKPSLYRLASVFAFPSHYEGFGLGPLEAMAAARRRRLRSLVGAGSGRRCGLPGRSGGLAGDGRRDPLADHPADLAGTMRNRGLARARDFSWRQTAEGTLAVYESLV